jgi:hypothetical protein
MCPCVSAVHLSWCSTSITHLSLAQTYYHTKEWNNTLQEALSVNTTIQVRTAPTHSHTSPRASPRPVDIPPSLDLVFGGDSA